MRDETRLGGEKSFAVDLRQSRHWIGTGKEIRWRHLLLMDSRTFSVQSAPCFDGGCCSNPYSRASDRCQWTGRGNRFRKRDGTIRHGFRGILQQLGTPGSTLLDCSGSRHLHGFVTTRIHYTQDCVILLIGGDHVIEPLDFEKQRIVIHWASSTFS